MQVNIISTSALIKTVVILLSLTTISEPQIAWGGNVPVRELEKRLFKAVFDNNLELVKSSITAGANLKATDSNGLTAAGLAIEKGYFPIAHYILGVINQKSRIKQDNKNIESRKINRNNVPIMPIEQSNKRNQIAKTTPEQITSKNPGPKTYKKWPMDKPNPFSPDNRPNEVMPIIGTLQKSPVRPILSHQTINLKTKLSKSTNATLKTPKIAINREIQTPTPIQPLDQKLKERKTSKVTGNLKSKTKRVKQEEERKEGLINKIWNKITNVF